jgi:drug/metabolite transporter (DMT)-like permease
MSIFLILFTYATWTTIFSLAKQTLQLCPPIFLTSTRMILAGILLLSYLVIFKRSLLKIQKKHILPLVLLAILSMYLTNVFEFWGLQHLSAAKTCFIYSLSPFFAAFFSYLHFKEKMNARKWVGMLIGFFGVISSFFFQSDSEKTLGGLGFISWPELALCGAALCSVYGWVLLRILVKDTDPTTKPLSPLFVNGSTMLLGGFFALIHSFFVDSWNPIPVPQEHMATFVKEILLMTFISNILCYNLYGLLLKKFTATLLSFFGLLSPFFTTLTSWLILGEKPSLAICLSTCIVLFGLWIVYREELRLGYIQKVPEKEEVVS